MMKHKAQGHIASVSEEVDKIIEKNQVIFDLIRKLVVAEPNDRFSA
jgi:hypothetical protein